MNDMDRCARYGAYFTKECMMGPNSIRLLDELLRKAPGDARFDRALLMAECGDRCDVAVQEAECFDAAWRDWFASGHEFALRDRVYLERGLDRILNFVLIYVRRKIGYLPLDK